ncbi:MAG: hypothetical protein PF441_08755 [Desulfuromusa sp.]|jgi:hypothetical protein|nr:hypothetical protein [Desulfuromusa sp.]
MAAKTALLLGKSLLFFTLWAAAIHFSAVQIVLKKQTATLAFRCSWFNRRSTARDWALKDGFAVTTPVFSFERFLALLTSLNGHHFTPVF